MKARGVLRACSALAGGFALSFVGLGLLWIGTPWAYQALLFFGFLLLAYAITRTGAPGDTLFLLILLGATPIGSLISLFRDKEGSHAMPLLILLAWVAGALAGHFLAARALPRSAAR